MIKNTAKFDYYLLEAIFGSDSLINIQTSFQSVGVSIDSRTIEPDNLFVALVGEKIDGHDKIQDAFEKGASAVIVNETWFENNIESFKEHSFIKCPDTLVGLGELAAWHRNRFDFPIIAVGGSNGKTTTKDLISILLSKKYNVLSTFENFNNRLGLPLMLLSIDESYNIAVLEMGTNEPGEIAILSEILKPTHGLITIIGKEHLEKLIDLDGVEFEETFLFGSLIKSGGTAYINMDDERLSKYARFFDKSIKYGVKSEDTDFPATILTAIDGKIILNLMLNEQEISINLNTYSQTSAFNALAASTVALSFGISPEEIKGTLENYTQESLHGYGRMVFERIQNFNLINDCYNANPDSMLSALETLNNFPTKGKKIAILGDMRELGDASENEHLNILSKAIEVSDIIFLHGENFGKAYKQINSKKMIKHFSIKSELFQNLSKVLEQDDLILVKGSRGMKMEEIVDSLKKNIF